MYGIDLSVQLENMMPFIGLGMSLGAVYDVFGLFRRMLARLKAVGFIADFIFCILAATVTYLLFLGTTNGVIRLYLLLSELTGAVIYFMTVGRLVSRVCDRIFSVFTAVMKKLFSPIFRLKRKIGAVIAEMKEKLCKKTEKM